MEMEMTEKAEARGSIIHLFTLVTFFCSDVESVEA